MKASIITVTLNSADTIYDCIHSVNIQSYQEIEHIIIDGGSVDNTIDIVRKNSSRPKIIISEPDSGIYDAMNKGIAVANGEIIAFLNSDDLYIDNKVVSNFIHCFKNFNTDIVYADIYYVKRKDTNSIIRKWTSGEYSTGSFRKGWHPAHPAFIVKKEVYEKYGGFNLSLKLSADFEIMLRLLEKYHISSYYLKSPIIKMRIGGTTNKSVINIIKQNIECYKAFNINDMSVSILYPFLRVLPKIKQFYAR